MTEVAELQTNPDLAGQNDPVVMPNYVEFAQIVAAGIEYETEYDGRMYTFCGYCNANLDEVALHHDSCAMVKARKSLGDLFVDPSSKPPVNASLDCETLYPSNHKVTCDICGKRVAHRGLAQHKRDSLTCGKDKA